MGQYAVMRHEPGGRAAWLIYQDQNLRIKQAGWNNPSTFGIHIWIWDGGNLVYDDILPAFSSGERNVPGNYQLQEVIDPELGPGLSLPEGIEYQMQWPA